MGSISCTKLSANIFFRNKIKILSNIRYIYWYGNNEFHWKGTYEEEYESFHKISWDGFVKNTVKNIQVVSIDAIDSEYIHSPGYYMVEFSSSPYILQ